MPPARLLLALTLALAGCASKDPAPAPAPAAPPASSEAVVLRGRLSHRPATMSLECYRAGGGEHDLLLDVEPPPPDDLRVGGGVVIRPSAAVSAEALAALDGRRVEVRGRWNRGAPAPPDDGRSARPVERAPDGTEVPVIVGVGLDAEAVTPLGR